MDIQINYDYRKEDLEKLPLHELTQFVLAREDKPFNTEVSISFVTDELSPSSTSATATRRAPPTCSPSSATAWTTTCRP